MVSPTQTSPRTCANQSSAAHNRWYGMGTLTVNRPAGAIFCQQAQGRNFLQASRSLQPSSARGPEPWWGQHRYLVPSNSSKVLNPHTLPSFLGDTAADKSWRYFSYYKTQGGNEWKNRKQKSTENDTGLSTKDDCACASQLQAAPLSQHRGHAPGPMSVPQGAIAAR